MSAPDRRPGVAGVGVDVVNIERFDRRLRRTPALLPRLFAPDEGFEDGRARPVRALAARFAAKEAALKALGGSVPGFRWTDIRVEGGGSSRPTLRLDGGVAGRAAELGVLRLHLSLSHDDPVAIAFVVAER